MFLNPSSPSSLAPLLKPDQQACVEASCASGSEHQVADARLNKRREVPQCMPVDVGCGHLMLVRLNSEGAGRQSIGLRVELITVIEFHAVAVREKEAIASQHATAIRYALLYATVGRRLHKASKRLNGGIGPPGFL